MKRQLYTPLAVALAAFAVFAATASAAIPVNTSQPTISGQLRQGSTLTVSNGSWSNAPLTYKYQWQRCGADGSGCADITGAVLKTYTLTSADVDHTVRAIVTATNADGSAQANSKPTGLISSGHAPTNTSKPTLSCSPVVGHELTATTGTWTGGVASYSLQ